MVESASCLACVRSKSGLGVHVESRGRQWPDMHRNSRTTVTYIKSSIWVDSQSFDNIGYVGPSRLNVTALYPSSLVHDPDVSRGFRERGRLGSLVSVQRTIYLSVTI